jgi:excinuclease ABC subunit A
MSIKAGGFAPGEYKSSWIFKQLEIIGEKVSKLLMLSKKFQEAMEMILNGGKKKFD